MSIFKYHQRTEIMDSSRAFSARLHTHLHALLLAIHKSSPSRPKRHIVSSKLTCSNDTLDIDF